jgi:hypothetical protein
MSADRGEEKMKSLPENVAGIECRTDRRQQMPRK